MHAQFRIWQIDRRVSQPNGPAALHECRLQVPPVLAWLQGHAHSNNVQPATDWPSLLLLLQMQVYHTSNTHDPANPTCFAMLWM